MGIALEHLAYISKYLADRPCSMCGAKGRSNFTLDQQRGLEYLFRFTCKCCGYPAVADLMSTCPDCADEYVCHGEEGCKRCHDTGVVRHYDIVRWRERNKYSTEATKRINAYARLQYEAADAEWNRDWPARPS
jgi:hypothetical protein